MKKKKSNKEKKLNRRQFFRSPIDIVLPGSHLNSIISRFSHDTQSLHRIYPVDNSRLVFTHANLANRKIRMVSLEALG